MASLSFYSQLETNLMSNRKVIELLLQLKSAKVHGKNYIKVKPHMVRHLLRNCLLTLLEVLQGCNVFNWASGDEVRVSPVCRYVDHRRISDVLVT